MCFPKVKKKRIIQGCLKIYKYLMSCHHEPAWFTAPKNNARAFPIVLYYFYYYFYYIFDDREALCDVERRKIYYDTDTRFYKINFMYSILLYCTG